MTAGAPPCTLIAVQHLRLGVLIVDHRHGTPCGVRQVGGREPHEAVVEAILASDDIAELCRRDDEDRPAELDFDERQALRDRYGIA